MSSSPTKIPEESFPEVPATASVNQAEFDDRLLFNDTIDDLLASGELHIDELPFAEPLISDESIAFLNAQGTETAARIARGEVELLDPEIF